MKDLNIDENFELNVINNRETTDFSILLQEEQYLKNLIIRNELHYKTEDFFEKIFDLTLYHGLSDEEIEKKIEQKLLAYYEKQFPQVREYLSVETFIKGSELTVFYVNKKRGKLLFQTEAGKPFITRG